MTKSYEMHVISHTHWDREWRYGFAETRLNLIDALDRMFDVLDADPDYRHFHLDGQTILLEDYLEIRPEMEGRLRDYISQGRILVGPWYTLPEEFLVSGESLVRNLLMGHRIAQRFGKVMKVGYTPTSCGQISQLPQIYAGFGIDSIFFYRGIDPDDAKAEFLWQSPDGTDALAFHFYSWTRSNFFSVILYPILFDGWRDLRLPDIKQHFHLSSQPYPNVHDSTDHLPDYHAHNLAPALKKIKQDALDKATTSFLLYMDGCDNGAPTSHTTRIIKEANALSPRDKYIHSNLPDYVKKVKRAVRSLQVIPGEMRRPVTSNSNAAFSGVLSARIYLKQQNVRAECNLTGRAERWAAIAHLLGQTYPKGALQKAWKYLLANHAHDSIGACSTDRVHDDMEYRYAQCDEMAQGVTRRSLLHIASTIPPAPGNDFSIIVFNSLPIVRTETVTAVLDLPAAAQSNVVTYQPDGGIHEETVAVPNRDQITQFALFDGRTEIPYQIASTENRNILVERLEVMTHQFCARRFHINFTADRVCAMGYKVFRVKPGPQCPASQPSLARSARLLQNEFLQVRVNTNGSLNIRHKQTGKIYRNLHIFEDVGEVGNSLRHQSPARDERITSRQTKADIALMHNGSLRATVRIQTTLSVPARASTNQQRRSRARKKLNIATYVTLRRGSQRLDIRTELDNQVSDHRLRVLFGTAIQTTHSSAAGQFDVLQRPIDTPLRKECFEPRVTTHPNYGFVDLSDADVGLAILNRGLTEYEILDDKKHTIALTLLRSFKNICGVAATTESGGQCLRPFTFHYAIYPHAGDYQEANVPQAAEQYLLPLDTAQSGNAPQNAANSTSFFSLEPACLILTALKRSENADSIIIRFHNPTEGSKQARLCCFRRIENAWETNLNEQRLRKLTPKTQKTISLSVRPKKVITLEVALTDV